MTQDEDHLRLLSIFHYVVSGLVGLFSIFPVFHLVFGIYFIVAPQRFTNNSSFSPALLGWFFVIFSLAFIAIGLSLALSILASGRFLARRKHYLFCLVMAGIECMFMPFGTVLGVFTIVVLMRESVKHLFASKSPV